jgi:hypothetical protein
MIAFLIGSFFLLLAFFIWLAVFPSKKYMSDIYQEMYLQQREQTKVLKDMRNVFFAKNRKFKKEGK